MECPAPQPRSPTPLVKAVEEDPRLVAGSSTALVLELLSKTVVQVNDHYVEPKRIDAGRMSEAMVRAVVDRSDGSFRVEEGALVAAEGDRWPLPTPTSIWQLPQAMRELGRFVGPRLPPGHRLGQGSFAETVMVNALLGTIDPQSVLLTPGALRAMAKASAADPVAQRQAPARTFTATRSDGPFLHLRLVEFSDDAVERARAALAGPGAPLQGVVLDLRGTPGGAVKAMEALADLFVAQGPLFVLRARTTRSEKVASDDGLASEQIKLVVLVDGATASGAEAVAGALRASGRAVLIGQRTLGYGLSTLFYDFKDRHTGELTTLLLSSGELLLPDGRSYHRVGLAPDVLVDTGAPAAADPPPGCAPLGETRATLRAHPGESDAALSVALRVLAGARSAATEDLLAAARAEAQHPR